ncbi:MAG: hypothetical protein AAGF93_14580, partial [Cyanobacteria bacterium P01_H01_bin.105]
RCCGTLTSVSAGWVGFDLAELVAMDGKFWEWVWGDGGCSGLSSLKPSRSWGPQRPHTPRKRLSLMP